MKRKFYYFLDKLKYFFVDKYENALNKLDDFENENNIFIVCFLIIQPFLIQFIAVISFIIVLICFSPIILICDFIGVFKILFKKLRK